MIQQSEAVVELHKVSKSFGEHVAVRDLSLTIPGGSIYGFIGPNGSGKTTTMRMLVNILRPDSGRISVFGNGLRGSVANEIGYMPEERGLYKKMKVRDLLLFYGRLKRKSPEVEGQVDRWLDRFELRAWAGKKVEVLSKGMSQKVQFIATVASNPRLLVLDEPLAGLDPINAEVIKDAISEIRKSGTTVILSTHDMAAAEEMCDFIFMIYQGEKVLDGTLSQIQADHGSTTLRIETESQSHLLPMGEGVRQIVPVGNGIELILEPDADPQAVLADLVGRLSLRKVEIAKPSLHEIFLRIAGPKATEDGGDHA